MSELIPRDPPEASPGQTPRPEPGSREDRLRRICLFDYLLHIVGLLLSAGLLSVIALIVNYLKRDEANGTVYRSHMDWMIATFWWTVLWVVLLFVPMMVVTIFSFGLLAWVFLLPGLWFLYRMIKGLLRLTEQRPVP
jgi:uncharacterized membrane protein